MKKIGKTSLFLILTFGISYLMAGLFYAFGGKLNSVSGFVIAIVYMLIPMTAVLIVEKLIYKEKIIQRLLISFQINMWFLVAWILPLIIVALTVMISLLFPNTHFSFGTEGIISFHEKTLTPEQIDALKQQFENLPVSPVLIIVLQALFAGITINAVAAFGEELGWRGFLLRQFENMNIWSASVLIGFIWGIWHAPIILMGHNYPNHPVIGVFMMTAWCILLSPLFLYITLKSRSVIAAAVFHGTINAIAGITLLIVHGGNDLTMGVTGLAGFGALLVILTVLIVYDYFFSKSKIMQGVIANHLPEVEQE